MNCQTFSQNPHLQGKSHHHPQTYLNLKPYISLFGIVFRFWRVKAFQHYSWLMTIDELPLLLF